MNPFADVYASLDGFVHRNLDRVGRRLDTLGPRARASAGMSAMAAATAMAYLARDRSNIEQLAYDFAAVMFVAEFVPAALEFIYGPNERRDGSVVVVYDRTRAIFDGIMRSVRLAPAVIGGLTAAYGVIGVVDGVRRGSLDPQDLRLIAEGSAFAAPAISSYLRDRDPPAPEADPMLAYLQAPQPVLAEAAKE